VGELRVVGGHREDDVFYVEVLVHDLQAREGDVDQVTRVHEYTLKQLNNFICFKQVQELVSFTYFDSDQCCIQFYTFSNLFIIPFM